MKNSKEPGLVKNHTGHLGGFMISNCLLCSHTIFILTPLPFHTEGLWPGKLLLAGVAKGKGYVLSCLSAQRRCGKKSISVHNLPLLSLIFS